jgi:hypothetical protein
MHKLRITRRREVVGNQPKQIVRSGRRMIDLKAKRLGTSSKPQMRTTLAG